MFSKKSFLIIITSLILGVLVLSEVSFFILDDPIEKVEEKEENRELEEFEEVEKGHKKLYSLKLPFHNETFVFNPLVVERSKKVAYFLRSKQQNSSPLYILHCSLKIDCS